MFKDTLWDLLNSGMFDTQGEVNNALIGGISSVLDIQYDDGEKLVNNLSPLTADENGIAQWEKILALPIDSTLSLQQRQQRSAAKAYRLTGALTKQQLIDILNSFSPSKSASVVESPSTYQVFGKMPIAEVNDLQVLLQMVKSVLPAHLQFIPSFVIPFLFQMQGLHSSEILVTRNIWANNGGIHSTDKRLDGEFLLDGSRAMNDGGHPDFDVLKSIAIAIIRIASLGPISAEKTTISVVRPAISEQYSTSQKNTIAVTRVAGPMNKNLLTGSWNLDGSVNLNRSAYPVTVKINGTAV